MFIENIIDTHDANSQPQDVLVAKIHHNPNTIFAGRAYLFNELDLQHLSCERREDTYTAYFYNHLLSP